MERLFVKGLIYKLIKYTDSSAIALAFTQEYGKLKLFMPKAFTKKSGILTLVPGEVDFLKKDRSDLNKLYGFRHDPAFMRFVEEPAISIRLSLIFDIFDQLYDVEQKESVLWTLITKFKIENAPSLLIYTIYAMLQNSGLMFDCNKCIQCGVCNDLGGVISNGIYYCKECAPETGIKTTSDTDFILRSLRKPDLYKNIKIVRHQEFNTLDTLSSHIETSIGKPLKSYNAFKSLISSL